MTKLELRNMIKEAIKESYLDFDWDEHLNKGKKDKVVDLQDELDELIKKHTPLFDTIIKGDGEYKVVDILIGQLERYLRVNK